MASEWAQAESYVDDEGNDRVFQLLPYEIETYDVPPPDRIPAVSMIERTPTPFQAQYLPEPCTPPRRDDMPSNKTIQAKFAAMDINHRMGSKKGEFPGNENVEPRGRWARAYRSPSEDLEAPMSPTRRKRSINDVDNVPAKKSRGRPRKSVGAKVDNAPAKRSRGRPRKQVESLKVSDELAFLMSDREDAVESHDDALPATSGRPRRETGPVHYRDMTAQEADAIKLSEQRAMRGSDLASEVSVDLGSENVDKEETEVEMVSISSESDKENEPPAKTGRARRQRSGKNYKDLTPKEADAIQAKEHGVMSGLQDDKVEGLSTVASLRRRKRDVPKACYRDMTAEEADQYQANDQRVLSPGIQRHYRIWGRRHDMLYTLVWPYADTKL